jgi:hypothetical protein
MATVTLRPMERWVRCHCYLGERFR